MQKIDIELRPSKQYTALLMIVFCGAMVCLSISQISWLIRCLLGIFLLGLGSYLFAYYRKNKVTRIQRVSEEEWQITTQNEQYTGTLSGDSTITLLCCVLRLKQEGVRFTRSYVIWHDALSKDHYRRLLAQIKCYKIP